jgi:hypothetical protein
MAVAYEYDAFANAAPANTALATLLTLSAGEELIQSWVICSNISAADITVRVGYGTGGSQDAWLIYDFEIMANSFMNVFISGLGSQNKIFVRTDSANDANFTVMGCKKITT